MADVPDRPLAQNMRTSDADRERIAARLRSAAAEGRLDLSELDERLGRLYAAKTYAELEPLTVDLPATSASAPRPGVAGRRPRDRKWLIAVLSGFRRTGRWSAPRLVRCVSFMGGGILDLRAAELVDGAIRIQSIAIMGGTTIIVPPDAVVEVTGIGIMGGFDDDTRGQVDEVLSAGGPRVHVSGFAFWGGVSISRRPLEPDR